MRPITIALIACGSGLVFYLWRGVTKRFRTPPVMYWAGVLLVTGVWAAAYALTCERVIPLVYGLTIAVSGVALFWSCPWARWTGMASILGAIAHLAWTLWADRFSLLTVSVMIAAALAIFHLWRLWYVMAMARMMPAADQIDWAWSSGQPQGSARAGEGDGLSGGGGAVE